MIYLMLAFLEIFRPSHDVLKALLEKLKKKKKILVQRKK